MSEYNIESNKYDRQVPNIDLGSELLEHSTSNNTNLKKIVSNAFYSFKFPSKGTWYNGLDSVSLAPLNMGQIVDLELVVREKNEAKKLKMLCSIIDRSVSDMSCFDMTVPDFYALCYELRLISSTDPIKVVQEINGFKMERHIQRDSLEIDYLNTKKDVSKFDYPRMRDDIYAKENEIESSILRNFFMYAKGDSPEEKINNFKSMSSSEASELLLYSTTVSHGINPVVKLYDANTGEFEEVEATFEAWMMFPSIIHEILYSIDI